MPSRKKNTGYICIYLHVLFFAPSENSSDTVAWGRLRRPWKSGWQIQHQNGPSTIQVPSVMTWHENFRGLLPQCHVSLKGMCPLNFHDVVCQVNNGNPKVLAKFTIWETIWMATISKHRRVTKSKYTWNNFTHGGSMGLVDVLEFVIHTIYTSIKWK